MINQDLTASNLKQQATRLRKFLATKNIEIGHSLALEAIANQHGYRDWNVLCSKLEPEEPTWPEIGKRVSGTYLGHAFTGIVHSVHVSKQPNIRRYTFLFDKPVDVVKSDKFTNLRRRISLDLNADLISVNTKGVIDNLLILDR
ncbi:MAG: hypothetical protein KDF58_08075 [Alphaproteobacteria bacterium]|nr:hypothetical protein [Alphaproteobacteria bacterium]HPF47402.1 glyoxalase superfamily protein [Emcibacteraceae bacterium]HRW29214.1 glyoxalase superfamily protein [Emcibacteraceae bacterium]